MREQKKIRSLKISYARQQTIYRTCQNYINLSAEKQEKIKRLCSEVVRGNDDDFRALFAVLTTSKSIRCIAFEHYMSERKLYYLRKQFYEKW